MMTMMGLHFHSPHADSNGGKFQGEYRGGKAHGSGKFVFASGNIIEGEWENDKPHGKAIFHFVNGSRFEGNYKAGAKNGHGDYRYGLTGNRYEGSFLNNKKHGRGRFTFGSGDVFEGDFVEDMRHGRGRLTFAASGNYYDGEWREDRRHGHGVFRYSNHCTYEGGWEGGQRQGAATVRWLDGDVDSVRYERDVLVGEGIRTCELAASRSQLAVAAQEGANDGYFDHDYSAAGKGETGNRRSVRLDGGEPLEEISSHEADEIAERLGLGVGLKDKAPPSPIAMSSAAAGQPSNKKEEKGSQI